MEHKELLHQELIKEIRFLILSYFDIHETQILEEVNIDINTAIENYINKHWKEKAIAMEIISRDYDYLKGRDQRLSALEEYGVDNWDGYEEAMRSIE